MLSKSKKQPSGLIIETHWSPDKHVVVDRVRYRERALSDAQSERAKLPRTGNPIKAFTMKAMSQWKADGKASSDFIDAAKNGSINGIDELSLEDDGRYSIVCRDIAGEKLVSKSTLAHWWTEANKPKKKKDR